MHATTDTRGCKEDEGYKDNSMPVEAMEEMEMEMRSSEDKTERSLRGYNNTYMPGSEHQRGHTARMFKPWSLDNLF